MTQVTAHAASDVGRVREGNEDSLYAGTTVFAVADGMGGHQAGEIASETALEPVRALDGRDFPTAQEAEEELAQAIAGANTQVVDKALSDPSFRGMGTTLTAVLVREDRLHVAHVGDSRAYLLRGNREMSQLTTDHTLVEELIRDGRLTRAEAASHPQRSVITRAIGVDRRVEVDTLPPIDLQPGDQVLLCSDGLTGPVPDRKIAEILATVEDGAHACQALIDSANEAGGPDNITVVLLRVSGDPNDARAGGLPGTKAATLSADSTEELEPPLPLPPSAPAGRNPSEDGEHALQIRTREEIGHDFADSMRRLGAPQGVQARPDWTRMSQRPRMRLLTVLVGVLLLLGLVGAGGWMLLNRAYYVGDHDGMVAIYNGLPQQVWSFRLHWVAEESDLPTDALPSRLRNRVEQGVVVGSLAEGRRVIANFREDVREPAPRPSPTEPAAEAPPETEPDGSP